MSAERRLPNPATFTFALRPQACAAKSFHSPGTPFNAWIPSSLNSMPEPATRVFHRPGDEHAARLGLRHDPSADVDGDSADVVTHQLAFAGVDARAHVDAKLFDADARSQAPQRTARAGPSNVARKPSPAVLVSLPRKRASSLRTIE